MSTPRYTVTASVANETMPSIAHRTTANILPSHPMLVPGQERGRDQAVEPAVMRMTSARRGEHHDRRGGEGDGPWQVRQPGRCEHRGCGDRGERRWQRNQVALHEPSRPACGRAVVPAGK